MIEFEQAQNYIPLVADANAQLISEEEKQAVRSAVCSLRTEYREAIHLIYFEDMTYEQAAAVMKKAKNRYPTMCSGQNNSSGKFSKRRRDNDKRGNEKRSAVKSGGTR